jgi:hypothetical protein
MKTGSQVQRDVNAKRQWEPSVHVARIGVTVKDGVVMLARQVDSYEGSGTPPSARSAFWGDVWRRVHQGGYAVNQLQRVVDDLICFGLSAAWLAVVFDAALQQFATDLAQLQLQLRIPDWRFRLHFGFRPDPAKAMSAYL